MIEIHCCIITQAQHMRSQYLLDHFTYQCNVCHYQRVTHIWSMLPTTISSKPAWHILNNDVIIVILLWCVVSVLADIFAELFWIYFTILKDMRFIKRYYCYCFDRFRSVFQCHLTMPCFWYSYRLLTVLTVFFSFFCHLN